MFIYGEIDNVLSLENLNPLLIFSYTDNMSDTVIKIRYKEEVYRENTISIIYQRFVKVLEQVLDNPSINIGKISLFLKNEKESLLSLNITSEIGLNKKQTLMKTFEEQVHKNPDKTALIYNGKKLTYNDLDQKANQVAHMLMKQGVKNNTLVGIISDRSIEMIIGLFGILKAGGGYVPLSPNFPKERLQFILQDSNVNILLIDKESNLNIEFSGKVFCLEDDYNEDTSSPKVDSNIEDIMYVMYTSGTTGAPKGVVVRQENVLNTLYSLHVDYPLQLNDAYLLKTAFIFDVSVTELFGWFFECGHLAILPPNAEKEPESIISAIKNYNVTHLNFSPSMLHSFLNVLSDEQINILNQIKYLFVAGESFSRDLANKCNSLLRDVNILNMYGPTEATIYASQHKLREDNDVVPIGFPLHNTSMFVLNKQKGIQPIGIPGEIYISGQGITNGYLNREELTSEKFIPDSINGRGIMYQSGDIGRYLPNGEIEFLGRTDEQVKIRGYRIELEEIESILLKHTLVKEAVVVPIEDEGLGKYLCAYITFKKEHEEILEQDFKNYLCSYLPDYMVPSRIIFLTELPINLSGKVDKKLLPKPVYKSKVKDNGTKLEQKIQKLISRNLEIAEIDFNENIFNLGVHSLMSIQLIHEINNQFNISLSVSNLYAHPTVRSLAGLINSKLNTSYEWNLTVLEDKLKSKFGQSISIQKYSVSNKEIIVLFKNVDKNLVIQYLNKLNCPYSLYPHYMLDVKKFSDIPINSEELFINSSFTQIDDNLENRIVKNLDEQNKILVEKIKQGGERDVYQAGFLQHAYLDRDYRSTLSMELNIENQLSLDIVNECLINVINDHDLLRSVLEVNVENGYDFHEFNKISKQNLPYVDLSECSKISVDDFKRNLNTTIIKKMKEQNL
ncbi:amino acid adenylation domain-containing protein [Bacillus pseudomycoides]|uniref:non-ribosomal peptide synthetase n=1 Tax=Bacillus pseudomycoides TaxID=64104 RepID=UPI001FB46368|nr:non-ribosomal peptide synthetase [Bacillus pseudomycoides]